MSDHSESPSPDGGLKNMKKPAKRMESVVNQEPLARKVASIMGDASAAALALEDYERRIAGGETVIIFSISGRWVVGAAAQVAQLVSTLPKRGGRAPRAMN